jgi:putative transposase
MPWSHTSPMDQKTPCIADDLRRTLSITELCTLYGVSRKTGYKWIDRYLTSGPPGLEDRSRKPFSSPKQTPQHVVKARIALRQHPPSWGAKQLLARLQKRHPRRPLPARSTVCELFSRQGLVSKTRHRRPIGHPGKPTSQILAPHEVWSADCKGHCTTGDGLYGDPLTVAEGSSRCLLGCHALSSPRVAEAKPVFTRMFQEFGLPQRIRTDTGAPCATNTLGRLSPRSAWWVRLGLLPACIEPGKPQQDGRHARLHRTLKAETTRPPARTRRAPQRTFECCREEFNGQRPHESLDMCTPAACDEPSPRTMPNTRPPLAYPDRFEVRDVSANGGLRWHHRGVNVSHVCIGAYVGLEAMDDGVWNVSFGPLTRGRLLERHRRVEDAYGRLKRRR